ncbi:1545_t:CDS:2 [Funneliformis mosseae]|uniref:1545_t:CDS:1 n=1 Tax=Funneliformis mosseae TaxID=27381 RepID=A0A9N8YKE2_FUNMO|nr:1545_t:CDS:2 [Funneliformis mosseae]
MGPNNTDDDKSIDTNYSDFIKYDEEETNYQMITDEKIIELMKELEEELNTKESKITLIIEQEEFNSRWQITLDLCLKDVDNNE